MRVDAGRPSARSGRYEVRLGDGCHSKASTQGQLQRSSSGSDPTMYNLLQLTRQQCQMIVAQVADRNTGLAGQCSDMHMYFPCCSAACDSNSVRTQLGLLYSRKYWRELNLALGPKIAFAKKVGGFKFGGLVWDRHRCICKKENNIIMVDLNLFPFRAYGITTLVQSSVYFRRNRHLHMTQCL